MQESIDVGDEIVTAGGLYGFVTAVGEDELEVEIAPDVVVRVATRAVAGVMADDDEEADEDDEPEEKPRRSRRRGSGQSRTKKRQRQRA
jgi:preprotein translocase subunit YajC